MSHPIFSAFVNNPNQELPVDSVAASRPGGHGAAAREDLSPAQTPGPSAAREGSGPLPRVLVVDDDPVATRALRHVLRRAGYDPILCHEGTRATEQADSCRPAAVLIDIHLGDMNGLVLALALRQRLGPSTPIFVISGDTSLETINSLPLVGATYFLSKPVAPSVVIERLRSCLPGPDAARPYEG